VKWELEAQIVVGVGLDVGCRAGFNTGLRAGMKGWCWSLCKVECSSWVVQEWNAEGLPTTPS
jgi:hypothetical protein